MLCVLCCEHNQVKKGKMQAETNFKFSKDLSMNYAYFVVRATM